MKRSWIILLVSTVAQLGSAVDKPAFQCSVHLHQDLEDTYAEGSTAVTLLQEPNSNHVQSVVLKASDLAITEQRDSDFGPSLSITLAMNLVENLTSQWGGTWGVSHDRPVVFPGLFLPSRAYNPGYAFYGHGDWGGGFTNEVTSNRKKFVLYQLVASLVITETSRKPSVTVTSSTPSEILETGNWPTKPLRVSLSLLTAHFQGTGPLNVSVWCQSPNLQKNQK